MGSKALTEQQSRTIDRILKSTLAGSGAEAIAVCDMSGNILAQRDRDGGRNLSNAAALAAGAMAATRALAELLDEMGFRSIAYRGVKAGVLVHAIGSDYFILAIVGSDAVEGMVRLMVRNAVRQIGGVLEALHDQTIEKAAEGIRFEIDDERSETAS